MKLRPTRRISLLAFALVAAGCLSEPSRRSPATGISARLERSEIIQLEGQTLIFRPSRDDITVASVVLSVYCSRPEAVLVNGAEPDSSWSYIELTELSPNRFELAPLRIESSNERRDLLCLSIKVFFAEVTNRYDSLYYENLDDRYALVSYCTSAHEAGGPDWEQAKPRFSQNRVATLKQFKATLSKPFEIRLNSRPLGANGGE